MHGKTESKDDTTAVDSLADSLADAKLLPSEPLRFSIRTLLIVTALICALLAVVVPAIRAARTAARRMSCQNNLKQIALAFHNYHDVYKTFPWATTYADDGTPMHSWRVRLMPYMESGSFYDMYVSNKEPWNGPKISLLGDEIPDTWIDREGKPHQRIHYPRCFRCPSAPQSQNPSIPAM